MEHGGLVQTDNLEQPQKNKLNTDSHEVYYYNRDGCNFLITFCTTMITFTWLAILNSSASAEGSKTTRKMALLPRVPQGGVMLTTKNAR